MWVMGGKIAIRIIYSPGLRFAGPPSLRQAGKRVGNIEIITITFPLFALAQRGVTSAAMSG
ncbi:hypothetical protein HYN43_003710 [Mucilaginibacter celer]|uniref:Uncharacterized protein n=1 Tax=Mucilaginibacter celer TaxID=2305508 RepID=A0A494VI12_9SPHI|nr:hypothetical protein HYN43_003710 [Mucilaginibacter celer]